MGDNDTDQRDYEVLRNHLMSALHSTHEQYDKAILTLSTGLLGLSVTFLRQATPSHPRLDQCILISSWFSLLAAISSTVASFLASQQAIRKALDDAYDLYRLKKLETLTSTRAWSRVTEVLNVISAVAFLVGATLTVVFVILNSV